MLKVTAEIIEMSNGESDDISVKFSNGCQNVVVWP